MDPTPEKNSNAVPSQPGEPAEHLQLNESRRTFIKKSTSAILAVTLVDLIQPFGTYAAQPDASCTPNPADPDATCGTVLLSGQPPDPDEACGKPFPAPAGPVDPDGNCGNSTTLSAVSDPDDSCAKLTPGGYDTVDSSCNKISSLSGAHEPDNACEQNMVVTTPDAHCSSTSKDANCHAGSGTGDPGDPDQHCGWLLPGGDKDIDNHCTIAGTDHYENPQ